MYMATSITAYRSEYRAHIRRVSIFDVMFEGEKRNCNPTGVCVAFLGQIGIFPQIMNIFAVLIGDV